MNKAIKKSSSFLLILSVNFAVNLAADVSDQKISKPGQYEGYSTVIYDGWQLSSQYITVRDGTRLAMDIIRPTLNGVIVEDKLPVLWMHTPYNRRPLNGKSAAETYPSGPINLVKYGYVIAVVDFRGLYGSFGTNRLYNFGAFVEPAKYDAYDITEWLADQEWSNGNIGMWGCSATGGSQQQAAATSPPSLKAIFPLSANFDAYQFVNYGGVVTQAPYQNVTTASRDEVASPVDTDDGKKLLNEAKSQHTNNVINQREGMPFRDSIHAELGDWWNLSSTYPFISEIRASGIGVYAGGNWDESLTKLAPTQLFANLSRKQAKLILGPQGHCRWDKVEQENGFSLEKEQLRFYDHWLKGIDNGVMDEPSVIYYTYHAPHGNHWQHSATWPPTNVVKKKYFMHKDLLKEALPLETSISAVMGEPAKSNSIHIDPKEHGLHFETEPLSVDTEITGFPEIHLWLSSDQTDVDVVAQLSDVAPDGSVETYQMVGRLRASHRMTMPAPYEYFDLPFHSHYKPDYSLLVPGVPVELAFGMLPMSYNFQRGHKIKLSLSFSNPLGNGQGVITLLAGGDTPSYILLPKVQIQN